MKQFRVTWWEAEVSYNLRTHAGFKMREKSELFDTYEEAERMVETLLEENEHRKVIGPEEVEEEWQD